MQRSQLELAKEPTGETVVKLLLAQNAQLSHELGVARAKLEQQRGATAKAYEIVQNLITERETLRSLQN
jgi:hypothetical protein